MATRSKPQRKRKAPRVWIGEIVPVGQDSELALWVDRSSGDTLAEQIVRTPRAGYALAALLEAALADSAAPPAKLSVGDRELVPLLRELNPKLPIATLLDDKAIRLLEAAVLRSPALAEPIAITLTGGEPVYTIKVTLRDVEPPVWRRVRIAGDASLQTLHATLQLAMGWQERHLHQFEIDGTSYGMSDEDAPREVIPEEAVAVDDVLAAGERAEYWYDFGDDWVHDLVVEQIDEAAAGEPVASCTDGARACPPEDSGGPQGYADKLRAMVDPQSDWDRELRDWMGDFDPESFALDEINEGLRELFVVGDDHECEGCEDCDCDCDEDVLEDMLADGFQPDYDADRDPDPAAWLALDQGERLLHVEAYHRLADVEPSPAPETHAVVHTIIESQLASDDPPHVRRAIDRVRREGLTRHEAVHAVGSVLTPLMLAAMRDGGFDERGYLEGLDALTAASWRGRGSDA